MPAHPSFACRRKVKATGGLAGTGKIPGEVERDDLVVFAASY